MSAPTSVLDASALLAFLRKEPGALATEEALNKVSAISVLNWAEALSKLSDHGQSPDEVHLRLLRRGIVGSALVLFPLDEAMALDIANLRAKTRARGLSLGDRACIALGKRLGVPILTADRAWKTMALGTPIRLIR